ncbi:Integrase catalytic domain-containing protein [Citrus sinensis]|uniref:Integrase catalytic domain-containing protein n=1 Tax=Citrus sinensis TaxID=2711 RepID=A0ACB8L379_CITSI|nr:Integrase catalytic domain-containing protein [Citrus sinensis]
MVTDHINTLKTLFSQLTTLGHNIEENERAELLLQSLLDSYDQLIINLTNNNPADNLVFDDVAASVLNEESRRKNKENRQANSQQAEALSVMRGRSTERGPSGTHNHGKSKSKSKKNVKCYNCGKKWYVKKECWSNQKRREGKEPDSSNAQDRVTSTSDDGEILYSETITISEGRKRLSDVWLRDSGATWHMTSQREWFHTYEPISGGSVYMRDDHTLEIAGIDTIKIKMFDGTIRTIGEFTVAYTPQQNRVAERMNKTLTERIRAMLRTAGLPNSFWAEAAKTVCYIVNRSPSTAIGLKTAMEMWTEKPADYSYLHAFGCHVYVMYNAQERTKLDAKSRRCIFLGYADGVNGYRLWDPTAHKIIISRDVIFVEDQLQRKDGDNSTAKEKSETVPVYVENNPEDSDSFEAAPEHEEQEPVESEAPETGGEMKILRRFNMHDCKPISTPLHVNFKLSSSMCPNNEEERKEMSRVPYASTAGSFMFAMICTRPDIAQAVGAVSRYMANPGGEHWIAVKRILRYIRETSDVALCYGRSEFTVMGCVDSDFTGDLDKRKSTTGYVFTLAGAAVSWVSKLQTVVALSTTEAEYMAATQACKEAIWIKRLLEELGHKQEKISVFCDSQSALHIARNPAFYSKTKHIGV